MNINILSCDWDYFFPDSSGFDWGHQEAPFFIEDIWHFRVNHIDLSTKKKVLDYFLPQDYKHFWERVISTKPRFLLVSESHANMWQAINEFVVELIDVPDCISVWNFDAHHDLFHDRKNAQPNYVDCSNWAYVGLKKSLIDNYILIYPPWRRERKEQFNWESFKYSTVVHYEMPPEIPQFDIVFICRSGAWTPPWCDEQWVEFVSWWKKYPDLWEEKTLYHDPLRLRKPDLEEAKKGFDYLEEIKKNFTN